MYFCADRSVDSIFRYHTNKSVSNDPFLLGIMNMNISDAQLYSNCRNNSFGCVKVPEGCSEYETGDKNIPCALAVSWIGTSSNTYTVHLHAYMNKERDSYVALGFPQQSLMSPAPVVACDTNHVINNTNIPSARVS